MSSLNVNRNINKLIIMVLMILSVLVVSVLYWLSPKNISNNETVILRTNMASTVTEPPKAITSTFTSTLEIPNADKLIEDLEISSDGHLKMTEKTRQRLDVFLGESKALSDAMMASTKVQIYQKMKEPAATEAITLLEHYAAYKKALTEMERSTPQIAPQNDDNHLLAGVKMQHLSALRNQYLTPKITQAFYADDDAKIQFELARQQIMTMNGLSDEQRQQQIAELQSQLHKSADTPYL